MSGSLGADLPCSELLARTKPFPSGLAGEKGFIATRPVREALSNGTSRGEERAGWKSFGDANLAGCLARLPFPQDLRGRGVGCVRGRRAPSSRLVWLQGPTHPARGLLVLLSINDFFFFACFCSLSWWKQACWPCACDQEGTKSCPACRSQSWHAKNLRL